MIKEPLRCTDACGRSVADMSELIDLDEVAAMWKCSRRHARDILTKRPDFPAPAPGSTIRHPVWLRSRVLAFAAGEPANDFRQLQTA